MTEHENAPVLKGNHRCSGGGDNRVTTSAAERERFANPRYHEGEQLDEQTTVETKPVIEEELCSHF